MASNCTLIYQLIQQPEIVDKISLSEWDVLIPQLRNSNLLARLCVLLELNGLIEKVPEIVRKHLQSARVVAEKNTRSVLWEVECIKKALEKVVDKIIVLKGGAYVVTNNPASHGRIFSDVDILVQKSEIAIAENNLMMNGWMTSEDDEYNQKYYRQWMHEIPPMHHIKRNTTIDVHHNILPETAYLHPDASNLIKSSVPVEDNKIFVLQPTDMVLHSATHLFSDGELEHGLRDLVDLDSLLIHFSANDDGFWSDLVERAKELDLVRPMYYALQYTHRLLNTPIPEEVRIKAKIGKPNPLISFLMDALFIRALAPDHPACNDLFTSISRWMLYIRSHYLRMPLYLLIPHLIRKSLKKEDKKDEEL